MASIKIVTEGSPANYGAPANENTATRVNVGQAERWISASSGGGLVVYGLLRRDWVGAALATVGSGLVYRGLTGHSFLYQAFDLVTVGQSPSTLSSIPGKRGVRVRRRMTINRSAEDLYNFWYDVEKAPLYMTGIESVTRTGDRTSQWIAKGPLGNTVKWNSELLQNIPGKLISWHAHGPSTTGSAGKVTFEPAPDSFGTVVTLELDFLQFKGPLGTSIGKIVGHLPERMAQKNLRQFKELMETGQIATIKGQPVGKGQPQSKQGRKQ